MHNIRVIARRELSSYFNSPVAYIVIFFFLLLAGWMYFGSIFLLGRADMRSFFASLSHTTLVSPAMLLWLIGPAVTMRLIAEERKSKTIELLTTMPVTDSEVILGKFAGAMGLLGVAILATGVYALTVAFIGPLDWGPVFSGYLALVLYVGSIAAIGLLASTLTESQIVAFIISAVVCASLYFLNILQFFVPKALGELAQFVSLSYHLDNMARGVIDTRDVLYYITLTGGALFLAVQSLRRRHA